MVMIATMINCVMIMIPAPLARGHDHLLPAASRRSFSGDFSFLGYFGRCKASCQQQRVGPEQEPQHKRTRDVRDRGEHERTRQGWEAEVAGQSARRA